MFSALDRLEGWQLLLVLAPLVLVMAGIRYREDATRALRLDDLNSLQKGWLFIGLLAPGLGARVLSLLKNDERERVLAAGGALYGSPKKVLLPVLEVFFKTAGQKGLPSKDLDELSRWLNIRFEDEPEELAQLYRKAYL